MTSLNNYNSSKCTHGNSVLDLEEEHRRCLLAWGTYRFQGKMFRDPGKTFSLMTPSPSARPQKLYSMNGGRDFVITKWCTGNKRSKITGLLFPLIVGDGDALPEISRLGNWIFLHPAIAVAMRRYDAILMHLKKGLDRA